MKKNCNQAEYRKDTCIMMKNFRVALACVFILVFSLVGILNSFASSPDPESQNSTDSSSTSSITLDYSSDDSDAGESPSGSSAQ